MYTPNSIPVFQAAFSGAVAGMAVMGKNISDPDSAHYATIAAIGGAWAQEFDTLYSGSVDTLSVTMIEDASQAFWAERQPTSESKFQVPATYADECAAIIALILAGETYFSGQGITPTPIGGGGGGGDTWQTDIFTATNGQTLFILDNDADPEGDLIFFVNGTAYQNGEDYDVVLNEVTWDKAVFELVAGDFCLALYPYIPV